MAEPTISRPLPSGHDEKFVKEVEDDFQCLICQLPLKEPVLTRCGHRFCKECLEEHLRRQDIQGQLYTCPADREVLDRDRDVFPDKATERKILSLTIKCPIEDCDWTGELRNKEVHLISCPFKVVFCTNENCQVSLRRIDMEQHLTSTCEWRIVECEYCREPLPECHMQDHVEKCSKFPLTCPNGCGDSIPREMIEHHDENDCPLSSVSCPYVKLGCNDKVQRKNVEIHLQTALREHLDFACVILDNTLVQLDKTQTQLNNTKIQLANTQATTRNLQKQLEALERREKKEFKERESENMPYIWKVNGFSEVFREAKAKTIKKISSAPFYTERYGYKLKLTIHPNGSGTGKNTHLSVFVVVMKGEYDAILSWPFNKAVTFTLLDQQKDPFEKENIVLSFTPKADEEINFRRPLEGENPGRGKAQFITHEKLQTRRYIVDDTLFLQVDIGP